MASHTEMPAGKDPALTISDLCKELILPDKNVVVLPFDSGPGLIVCELLRNEPFKVDAYDRIRIINKYNISEEELFEEMAALGDNNATVIIEGLPKEAEHPINKAIAKCLTSDKCDTIVLK